MSEQHYYYGTGRRKTAIAQVRVYMESGPIVINGKPIEEFFPRDAWQKPVMQPFHVTASIGQFRVVAKVKGGWTGRVSMARRVWVWRRRRRRWACRRSRWWVHWAKVCKRPWIAG